jgi:hypothetical protein
VFAYRAILLKPLSSSLVSLLLIIKSDSRSTLQSSIEITCFSISEDKIGLIAVLKESIVEFKFFGISAYITHINSINEWLNSSCDFVCGNAILAYIKKSTKE